MKLNANIILIDEIKNKTTMHKLNNTNEFMVLLLTIRVDTMERHIQPV